MPFVLILVGSLLLVAGVRNKQDELFSLVKGDFTGPHNFIYWFVAILAIGAVGYVRPLKPLSDIFLALVIVVLILSNKGFFAKFTEQINSTQSAISSANSPETLQSLPTIDYMKGLNLTPIDLSGAYQGVTQQ